MPEGSDYMDLSMFADLPFWHKMFLVCFGFGCWIFVSLMTEITDDFINMYKGTGKHYLQCIRDDWNRTKQILEGNHYEKKR